MVAEDAVKAEEFRQEVRAWLMENLPEGWGTPEYKAPDPHSIEARQNAKAWMKKLYDAGYTALGYPVEYGGIERPPEEVRIIRQEMARTGTPPGQSVITWNNVLPTLLAIGQEWQKKRFVPRILNGEEAWVQGFSEPNAGSDLANVQTTGVRDGDEWVVNGQKVWTSAWPHTDFGVVVVKTEPNAPRHRNLSYFIFDCKSPGFSMSPLKQMTGGSEFCEMFFDNVRIPHENLLGELHMGWYGAVKTLNIEREAMASDAPPTPVLAGFSGEVKRLYELALNTRRRGKVCWDDATIRQRIAHFAISDQALQDSNARAAAKMSKGVPPGQEASMAKNFAGEMLQYWTTIATDMLGGYSQMWQDSAIAVDDGFWVRQMLHSRAMTIAGGTTEINNNIIAEKVLGMPR